MREVSGRVTAMIVDAADRSGVDLEPCLAGTTLSRRLLADPRSRIDWDVFVDFLVRLEPACGGPAGLQALIVVDPLSKIGPGARTGHPFVRLARVLFGGADIYRLLARWALARDLSVLRASFEEEGADRARLTVTIDESRRGSPEFFRLFYGVVRLTPTLVGLPLASVTVTATSHQAVYTLELARPASLASRARRAIGVLGGAAATLQALELQSAEIRAANELLQAQLAEQRRIEAALREQEALLELALEAGHLGIWSWDMVTDRLRWSAGLARVLGLAERDVPQSLVEYMKSVHPDDRSVLEEALARAVRDDADFECEHRALGPDGVVSWFSTRGQVLRAPDGTPHLLTGTTTDVSEKKRLETQLLLADRLTSLGKLAAGVAHELNNPLTYVLANVELLRSSLDRLSLEDAEARALADSVAALADGAGRMRHIMGDLRTFSHPGDQRRAPTDLRRVVDAALRLVSNEVRHRAEVLTDFASDVPEVLCNESRLGQVFINLLVNAAHAIPDSPGSHGVVRVRTYRDAQGRAVASIEDNGGGIAPAALRRLFEPFFTTKEIGHGTGLGLAVCESIVTSLGGTIEVDSEVGRGSTFRVVLPAATGRAAEPEVQAPTRPTGGRILVIDDEPILRRSLKALLSAVGFDVTIAESGREGLDLALGSSPFDVILCDLMMPDMTGMDVHEAVVAARPDIAARMVFLTGGAFTPRASAFLDRVSNAHVDKPFALDTMIAAIEKAKSI